MVTFENRENYLIRFEILNHGPILIFDLIQNEKKQFTQHWCVCVCVHAFV